jgi:TldD protein
MEFKKIAILHERIKDTINAGADYSDIYIQSSSGHAAHYEEGKIEELSSSTSNGSGARIVLDNKTFYSHTSGIDFKNINEAFSTVIETALNKKTKALDSKTIDIIEPCEKTSSPEPDILQSLNNEIRKASPLVRQVTFRYSVSKKRIFIIKPDASVVSDTRDYSSFVAQVIVERKGILYSGSERMCKSVALDKFWGSSTPSSIANIALQRALLMTRAKACPAGRMQVLFAGEAGGTIIHEACGHGLEADIVDKDYSIYRDRIGQLVANKNITMIDDPTIPSLYGSYKFDDEGVPAQRSVLIENGVLKSYISDILSAKKYNAKSTGNGRRESFKYAPVPRMSNTFILPGNATFESMLDRIKNGIYVKKMGGGEVNPTTGDFVFFVSEGYLVRNGKVSYPVRGATLSGNGPSVLKNIIELGNNLVMDSGICGKSGQGVPVTDGQPSMLVDGLTVGGSEA